jgi:hypothetical protein
MRFGLPVPRRCDELGVCQDNHAPMRCAGCKPKAKTAEPDSRLKGNTELRPLKLQPGVVDGPYKQTGKGVAAWLKGLLP